MCPEEELSRLKTPAAIRHVEERNARSVVAMDTNSASYTRRKKGGASIG